MLSETIRSTVASARRLQLISWWLIALATGGWVPVSSSTVGWQTKDYHPDTRQGAWAYGATRLQTQHTARTSSSDQTCYHNFFIRPNMLSDPTCYQNFFIRPNTPSKLSIRPNIHPQRHTSDWHVRLDVSNLLNTSKHQTLVWCLLTGCHNCVFCACCEHTICHLPHIHASSHAQFIILFCDPIY